MNNALALSSVVRGEEWVFAVISIRDFCTDFMCVVPDEVRLRITPVYIPEAKPCPSSAQP